MKEFGPEILEVIEKTIFAKYKINDELARHLHRVFQVSFYEGFRAVLQVKNEMRLTLKDIPHESVNVEEEFTVVERQVIFYYI